MGWGFAYYIINSNSVDSYKNSIDTPISTGDTPLLICIVKCNLCILD